MELNVRGLNLDLTAPILEHVQRRVGDGLSHYKSRLGSVTVRLSDVNGPRGGAGKRCHLEVTASGLGTACVDGQDPDLYRAVDLAVARLGRQLARGFGRRRARGLSRRVSASGLPT